MMFLKKIIKQFLRRRGYEIHRGGCRVLSQGYCSHLGGLLQRLKSRGLRPATIIDVGVKFGTHGLYDVFDSVQYLLVDPLTENEPFMKAIASRVENVKYELCALGDAAGELEISVYDDGNASFCYMSEHRERRSVRIKTLDSLAEEHGVVGPVVLKVDTEGFELNVLRGAEQVLKMSDLVVLEVAFIPPQGVPEFCEISEFMNTHGFALYDILGLRERPIDGALGLGDVAYVKKDGAFRRDKRFRTTADEIENQARKAERRVEMWRDLPVEFRT